MAEENNYFVELNSIDVSGKTEQKNGLTYLSWPWAWGELKKRHPDATYKVYENIEEWNYFTDGRTCWVKVGVTVNGIEHVEQLPVMDFKNKSIPLERVTSFDVNKSIQRALTKAIARHGLGLYIYAGEDLPEDVQQKQPNAEHQPPQPNHRTPQQVPPEVLEDTIRKRGFTVEQFEDVANDRGHNVSGGVSNWDAKTVAWAKKNFEAICNAITEW